MPRVCQVSGKKANNAKHIRHRHSGQWKFRAPKKNRLQHPNLVRVLDFFREEAKFNAGGDPRYGGLTPAQWACFGLLALGIYLLRIAANSPRTEPPKKLEVLDAETSPPETEAATAPIEGRPAPQQAPDGAKNEAG